MVGGVVSPTTMTVLVTEAVLPIRSAITYVIVYTFGDWRSTATAVTGTSLPVLSGYVISLVIKEVMSPSKSSVAVAPRSVHWASSCWFVYTLIVLEPTRDMVGGVVSG